MACRKRSRNPVWGGLRAGVCRMSRKRCSARWPTEWPRQARFPVAARDLTLPPGVNVTTRRGRMPPPRSSGSARDAPAACSLPSAEADRNASSAPAFGINQVDEPDRMQFEAPGTGLPCLIVPHRTLDLLCGYVGVPNGHPWHGKETDGLFARAGYIDVTFTGSCEPAADERYGICHVPTKDEPDHEWWIGLHCAHAHDISPGLAYPPLVADAECRDMSFVKNTITVLAEECARAAAQ